MFGIWVPDCGFPSLADELSVAEYFLESKMHEDQVEELRNAEDFQCS